MDGSSVVRRAPFGSNPEVGERGSETEQRILQGALQVFAEVGFNEARVELITQHAGCSRSAFYQYFADKDDVFWKLGRELGAKMVSLARQLEPVGPDAAGVTALAAWVDDFTSLYQAYSPVFSTFQAASRGHQAQAEGSGTFSERLDDALLRAFGRRRRRGRDQALASAMVAVLIRCNFYWEGVTATAPVQRRRLVDGLAEAVHRLFHGPIDGVNVHRRPVAVADGDRPPGAPLTPPRATDRPLRPRGEQTRRRLLDAGTEVIPARGYHDARVDDIVIAAGVSHGSFYRYFDDKDDFFQVLAEEASTEMTDLLSRFPAHHAAAALHTWVSEWFSSYESNGGVITVWQEMQEAGGDLVAFSQQVAAAIVTGLVARLDQRDFGDPLVDALILLALIERLPYRSLTLGFTTRAAAIDAAVTVIRRSLMGLAD